MLPFKKILWPTDFSEASYEALKMAQELALHFSSELYIVHVVPPLPPVVEVPSDRPKFNISGYLNELKLSAKKSLQVIIDKKIDRKLEAHAFVRYGDAAVEIDRIAKKRNVGLIVMATHGTTGWRRHFFGSITEKVLRIASCSVLTVQAPHERK
jgi:nucleotide-binding universal stress UspA family protein